MTKARATGVLARPGDTIGILGGGQLGRMLAMAAADLGRDVHVLTPEQDSPASRVAKRTWVAPFDDRDALREFAASPSPRDDRRASEGARSEGGVCRALAGRAC